MSESPVNRILILDDDEQFNKLLTSIFAKSKIAYQVESFTNPVEALKAAKEGDYKLVITDYQMPEMDGLTFTQELRTVKNSLPLIMVSAYLTSDKIYTLMNHGVMVFLKPLNIFNLIEKIGKMIEGGNSAESQQTQQKAIRAPHIAYPGNETGSNEYYDELLMRRNFSHNLTMRGSKYSPWQEVYEDLKAILEHTGNSFQFTQSDFTQEKIQAKLQALKKDSPDSMAYFFLPPLDLMNEEGFKTLQHLLEYQKNAANDENSIPLGLIHTTYVGLDMLLEKGILSPKLYLLMGYRTVRLPRLANIPKDAWVLLQRLITKQQQDIEFDNQGYSLVCNYSWPGDYQQLKAVAQHILKNPIDSNKVNASHINTAIKETYTPEWEAQATLDHKLQNYSQAIHTIFGDQPERANHILRMPA